MQSIKNFFERNQKGIVIISFILLFCIGLVNFSFIFVVNATSNDECLWEPKKISKDSVAIYFEKVKINGVTWKAGIRDGDQLIAINKIKLKDIWQAQRILNKYNTGEFALYTIKQGDKLIDTKVEIKKLIQIAQFAFMLMAQIWLVIGFVVLMARPNGYIQRLFYKISAAYIILFTSLYFLGTSKDLNPLLFVVLDYVWTIGGFFASFLILRFFWSFPKPFKFAEKKWVKNFLRLAPVILIIAAYIVRHIFVYPYSGFNTISLAIIGIINLLILIALIVGLISLYINYFRIKNKIERKPIYIILVAYTIGILSLLYTNLVAPAISDTVFNSPEYYTPILMMALIPVAFGYSIFRYQLMDVSIVVKNAIIYGAATITVASAYFLVIYLLGQGISQAIGTQYQGIIAGIIFIIFALVFQSTKDRFQNFLTEKFYPEQFAHQKVLVKFSNEVTSIVGLENILDKTFDTFTSALRINNFGIMVRDQNNGDLKVVRSKGMTNTDLRVNQSAIYSFVQQKSSLSKLPVIEREDFPAVFKEKSSVLEENEIYTIVPMIIKTKIVGLLLFGLKHSGAQFSHEDTELLNAVASQAAISIENARLYEAEKQKISIERDLDLARKIQQSLLPSGIPKINRLDICGQMIPAMQVGGDYYDLIKLSDSKIFVVVGDVSGKGLSASLYMAKLQTMIQLACTPDKTPKQILVEINKRLYESLERSWFVTMTLALFDSSANTVKFCRAGHMPLITANNGSIDSYKSRGIGIGLESGSIFESSLVEEEVQFKSGQIFAFFSDGITEAMNEVNELFGEDKLSELLRNKSNKTSSEVMNDIWKSLTLFRGRAEQNDDMTMVLVKVI
ncbi:MAG: SpoIIE family protein phosphatase [Ignavibacteriaceae bacterium]|nr:SpoIIE family protein phosphatase [Ignavibacteriaceae bacterium]